MPEKINYLNIQNVARIGNVEFTAPKEGLIIVGGKNEAGKTTLIEAIYGAMGGKVPALKKGKTSGKVTLELKNYNITLFLGKKNKIKVEAKDTKGSLSQPKTLLQKIFGKRALDVTSFLSAQPKDQINTLLKVLDIPATKEDVIKICNNRVNIEHVDDYPVEYINEAYQQILAEQRIITRSEKVLIETIETNTEEVEQVNLEPFYLLKEKYLEKDMLKKELSQQKEKGLNLVSKQNTAKKRIVELQEMIDEQNFILENFDKDIIEARKKYTDMESIIKELAIYNIEEIESGITNGIEDNKIYETQKENRDKIKKLEEVTLEGNKIKEILCDIRQYKLDVIAKTKFPVDKLTLKDGEIYYQGFPLKKASGAKQMIVATAIAASEIPKDGLQALFILDPPQLDNSSWAFLEEYATERNIQIWIAKVEEKKEKAHIYLVEGVQQ